MNPPPNGHNLYRIINLKYILLKGSPTKPINAAGNYTRSGTPISNTNSIQDLLSIRQKLDSWKDLFFIHYPFLLNDSLIITRGFI